MPAETAAHPLILDWKAQVLRLTAFPTPSSNLQQQTWWMDVVHEPPETKVVQEKKGVQQEGGPFQGNGTLVLHIEPTRIDWIANAESEKANRQELQVIGSLSDIIDQFIALMQQWFEVESCPPLQRLAFGAVLIYPVLNRQEGYRLISSYLPFTLDPEGSSDFSYQINRPRNSITGIPDLRINRLSKWSVGILLSRELTIAPSSIEYRDSGTSYSFCRLEVDVNTVKEFAGELSRQDLPRVFRELVDLGSEIARRGDCP